MKDYLLFCDELLRLYYFFVLKLFYYDLIKNNIGSNHRSTLERKNTSLYGLNDIKPIISGINRKCVGGPKNYNHFWTQWVRLHRYGLKQIQVGQFKGLKPTISGFTGSAWADSKSDVTIVSAIIESPYIHDLTRTLYFILEDIGFFRFTSGFSGTSGYRKWSKPLPRHNFNLCLCPQKRFGWISCLARPWLSAPIFMDEKKTRQCKSW